MAREQKINIDAALLPNTEKSNISPPLIEFLDLRKQKRENSSSPVDEITKKIGEIDIILEDEEWKILMKNTEELKDRLLDMKLSLETQEQSKALKLLLEGANSLRSSQTRLSLQLFCQFFKLKLDKTILKAKLVDIVSTLLLKSSNEKKFIASEGLKALKTLSECYATLPLAQLLLSYGTHKNNVILANSATFSLNVLTKLDIKTVDDNSISKVIAFCYQYIVSSSAVAKKKVILLISEVKKQMYVIF